MIFRCDGILWQSPDGTWNNGAYETLEGPLHPDGRPEYGSRLQWVSTGHPNDSTARAARYHRYHFILPLGLGTEREIAYLEQEVGRLNSVPA